MADYTKYPNQIDTTSELPKATDLVTPVKAEVVNRLRDAIMALENELGIQPSATFSTVRARLDDMDRRISALENLDTGGGGVGDGLGAKVRVYRSASAQAGGAVTVPMTVIWDGASLLIDSLRATTAATTISPTISGNYLVSGQLTLAPTIDSISGVTIDILRNGITIYTRQDRGAVWGVGLERAILFSFLADLAENDELSVVWTHSGSALSTTELVTGDDASWFAFSRVAGLE